MKIAYVLNTYPQPSHSFIRRELRALEAAGTPVLRLAMRRSAAPLVDPRDREEEARTDYVLETGAARLGLGLLGTGLRRPRRFLRALRLALKAGAAAPGARARHLVYLAEACRVLALCRAQGIDHVHAHFGTNAATVAMLCTALGGPGYSFTVHGPEEFDAPAALSLPEKIARAEFTVAISSFGRSQLRRWCDHADWHRIRVVHCGVEPARFAEPPGMPDGALRLVSIGRLVEQKGQMTLIPVIDRLRATLPGIHLTLVGDGPLRGVIENEIAKRGLSDSVTLTGWLSEAGVEAALADAHALVLPSFAEGLPMVVMEAMATGRPVIASRIAGIPELVRPDETGWLVPASDEDALQAAITDLAGASPERLARIRRAARARVLERHDASREAGKLAAHFRGAIAPPRGP